MKSGGGPRVKRRRPWEKEEAPGEALRHCCVRTGQNCTRWENGPRTSGLQD